MPSILTTDVVFLITAFLQLVPSRFAKLPSKNICDMITKHIGDDIFKKSLLKVQQTIKYKKGKKRGVRGKRLKKKQTQEYKEKEKRGRGKKTIASHLFWSRYKIY